MMMVTWLYLILVETGQLDKDINFLELKKELFAMILFHKSMHSENFARIYSRESMNFKNFAPISFFESKLRKLCENLFW